MTKFIDDITHPVYKRITFGKNLYRMLGDCVAKELGWYAEQGINPELNKPSKIVLALLRKGNDGE